MKIGHITAAYVLATMTLVIGNLPQCAPDPEPQPEIVETQDFGDLRGIPPEIEDIAQRYDQGYHVTDQELMILSDYIETELDAWNRWVESLETTTPD